MDGKLVAILLMVLGIAALFAALGLRRTPSRQQPPVLTLPGLGLILDDGTGAKQLTVAHAGTAVARNALGLDDKADENTVFAALSALTRDKGTKAVVAINTLLETGEGFSHTYRTASGTRLVLEGALNAGFPVIWATKLEQKKAPQTNTDGLLDMLDRAPLPAWRLNAAAEMEWANEQYVYAVDAKSVDDVVNDNIELSREATQLAKDALAQQKPVSQTLHIVIDGERHLYQVHAQPSGNGVAMIAQDIQRAETAESALEKHQQAHDQTLDHLADGVAIFGKDKRLIFFNTAFAKMWELEPAWLNDHPSHAALLDRLREQRKLPATHNYSEWKQRELGFYVNLQDTPDELWALPDRRTLKVFRQPHPLGGILVLFEDITNELALKSQYNALIAVQKVTLDKLHEGVAVFSSDGRLRLHNSAFEEMWGLKHDDCINDPTFDEIIDHCLPLYDDREVWADLKARLTDPSPEARVESIREITRKDGSIITYRSRPLPDGATLVAWADITASKRVETALLDRAEALEEASKLKSDFVGHVSYQLRNPLTTIMGYAELMGAGIGGALNDKQTTQVAAIRQAADQLNQLIEDILDLATIDAGEMELNIDDVDLKGVISSTINLLTTKADDSRLSINTKLPKKLGPIQADEKRLKQVLYNLLGNAIRHTPAGGSITVGVNQRGKETLLWVEDDGCGIPHENQAQVFDSFTVGEQGGAGLGLSLVHRFVDMHGGWVELESEPQNGTKVTCHLPKVAYVKTGQTDAQPETTDA